MSEPWRGICLSSVCACCACHFTDPGAKRLRAKKARLKLCGKSAAVTSLLSRLLLCFCIYFVYFFFYCWCNTIVGSIIRTGVGFLFSFSKVFSFTTQNNDLAASVPDPVQNNETVFTPVAEIIRKNYSSDVSGVGPLFFSPVQGPDSKATSHTHKDTVRRVFKPLEI